MIVKLYLFFLNPGFVTKKEFTIRHWFWFKLFNPIAIVASRTVRFLEDYGILAFTEQVWSKLSHYTMIAYRLVPTYISTSTMHLQKNFHFEQTILKTLSLYLLILATSLIRKKCMYWKPTFIHNNLRLTSDKLVCCNFLSQHS